MIIFESILTTIKKSNIFEAAGPVVEIGSSLNIMNFNQVKLGQIRNTHCSRILCIKVFSRRFTSTHSGPDIVFLKLTLISHTNTANDLTGLRIIETATYFYNSCR